MFEYVSLIDKDLNNNHNIVIPNTWNANFLMLIYLVWALLRVKPARNLWGENTCEEKMGPKLGEVGRPQYRSE